MKYYEIEPKDGFWLLGDIRNGDELLDNEPFLSGKPGRGTIGTAQSLPLDIHLSAKGPEAGLSFTTLAVPVARIDVADRLAQFFPLAGKLEFALARIEGNPAHLAVLNVLDVVDAVDREHSKFSLWTRETNLARVGEFHTLEHLVFKERELRGHHLFRIKGYPIPLFASEDLRRALGDVAGVNWVPVEVRS